MRENENVGVLHAAEKFAEQRALARTRLAGHADAPRRAVYRGGDTEVGQRRNDGLPANEVAGAIAAKSSSELRSACMSSAVLLTDTERDCDIVDLY